MTDPIRPGDRVAFLGIGHMGLHMANVLAAAGFVVAGWNRSRQDFHAEARFPLVDYPGEAVAGCRAVILCLRDQHVVETVLFGDGLAEQIERGSVVIDMGTSGPILARHHAERLSTLGIRYLDAPVSGGSVGARNASLSIFAGGDAATFEIAEPLLRAMGRPCHMGPVGSGQTTKLANQIIVGITIAAVAEGMAYAEKNGIDGAILIDALKGGFASSRILDLHGPRMAARDYSAPGAIRLHLKDLRLAGETAGLDGLQHAAAVTAGFEKLAAAGHDGLDHSAYAALYQATMEGRFL